MTRTVFPSMTHSNWVFGPIPSRLRTSEGTDTCPRFVTFVRMILILQEIDRFYTSFFESTCNMHDPVKRLLQAAGNHPWIGYRRFLGELGRGFS